MSEYVIAEYIRLSIEDEKTESLSIPAQRKIINQHISTLDIPDAKIIEFVDNGYSGTMMERPALQDMLDLVESGGIACIIIKDFSRLSRNAPESSYLVEQIFPFYRIRFISVSDDYDSGDYYETTGGLGIHFKHIMHEHYSNDLSKKVKSAKRYKMEHGLSIVAGAIYGYQKNNVAKWEMDPIPAKIVQEIYTMALKGLATSQIRDELYKKRYPTPREYIEMKRGKDIVPECMWTARMVLHMLTNEQYTGTYVSGKQESIKVGSHSKKRVDKSKWIIIPDSHPAIVSKADFSKVQDLLKYRKGSTTTKPLQADMNHPHRISMLNGESVVTVPIYGYKKSSNGKLEIDKPASQVIWKIFDMAEQGLTCVEISEKLFEFGYPTPSEYKKLGKKRDIIPTNRWTDTIIREILKNEQYTGAYVSGKILKNYETGKSYHTPRNEWIVIPDNHTPIISKKMFDKVQEITVANRYMRKDERKKNYLLRGLVVCGCCGYALAYDSSSGYNVYRCHHTLADVNAMCYKMKINAHELDEAVIALIMKQSEVVLNDKNAYQMLSLKGMKKSRTEYQKKINEASKQMQACYEKHKSGQLEEKQYTDLMNEYSTKIEQLEYHISSLKKAERERNKQKKTSEITKETINESTEPRKSIETLVKKVYVFPDNQIKIDWKFTDFSVEQ